MTTSSTFDYRTPGHPLPTSRPPGSPEAVGEGDVGDVGGVGDPDALVRKTGGGGGRGGGVLTRKEGEEDNRPRHDDAGTGTLFVGQARPGGVWSGRRKEEGGRTEDGVAEGQVGGSFQDIKRSVRPDRRVRREVPATPVLSGPEVAGTRLFPVREEWWRWGRYVPSPLAPGLSRSLIGLGVSFLPVSVPSFTQTPETPEPLWRLEGLHRVPVKVKDTLTSTQGIRRCGRDRSQRSDSVTRVLRGRGGTGQPRH